MSKRQPRLLIEDIIDSGNKILDYTKSMTFNEFIGDSKTVDAVVRNFEIIGEAANRLPEEFKDAHADIDWHRIKGFRNRIVHTLWLVSTPTNNKFIQSFLNRILLVK